MLYFYSLCLCWKWTCMWWSKKCWCAEKKKILIKSVRCKCFFTVVYPHISLQSGSESCVQHKKKAELKYCGYSVCTPVFVFLSLHKTNGKSRTVNKFDLTSSWIYLNVDSHLLSIVCLTLLQTPNSFESKQSTLRLSGIQSRNPLLSTFLNSLQQLPWAVEKWNTKRFNINYWTLVAHSLRCGMKRLTFPRVKR